jgi:hypothetical protein
MASNRVRYIVLIGVFDSNIKQGMCGHIQLQDDEIICNLILTVNVLIQVTRITAKVIDQIMINLETQCYQRSR